MSVFTPTGGCVNAAGKCGSITVPQSGGTSFPTGALLFDAYVITFDGYHVTMN